MSSRYMQERAIKTAGVHRMYLVINRRTLVCKLHLLVDTFDLLLHKRVEFLLLARLRLILWQSQQVPKGMELIDG